MAVPAVFFFLAFAAASQAATTLTSQGCADASGFEKCQAESDDKTSACIAQAKKDGSQQEILACTCVDYVQNYNCYSSHCWNRVWECEYQDYMVGYFQNCLTAKLPVPYFPAPDNVADACSCNLGKVYTALHSAISENTACSNAATHGADAGNNLQRMEGCTCCAISGSLSSLVEICPDTDPNLIGLSAIQKIETAENVDFKNCGPYMQTYNCVSDLGFSLDGVSKYYAPDDQLKTGTQTLSNGPGSVTSPASGAVFTYTNGGDGIVYTITAANFKRSSGDSSDSSESGSQVESGGSAAAATTTGDSGGGVASVVVDVYSVAAMMAVVLFISI